MLRGIRLGDWWAGLRSSARLRGLLRAVGLALYFGLVAVIFLLTAYVSFSLFVKRGVTTVPDLLGLTEAEAQGLLADQGLALRRSQRQDRYDPEVPAGRILAHDPGAGSLVKKGSAVEATFSLGAQLVEVPDLRGEALQASQVTLAAAGLSLGHLADIYSNEGEPGTVVYQHPQGGTRVGPSNPVNLLLSLGNPSETYLMPDLIYRRYEEVRSFFSRHSFRLGSVKFEPYEGIERGVVLRQFPRAGHPLRRTDVISLVVSASSELESGPAP